MEIMGFLVCVAGADLVYAPVFIASFSVRVSDLFIRNNRFFWNSLVGLCVLVRSFHLLWKLFSFYRLHVLPLDFLHLDKNPWQNLICFVTEAAFVSYCFYSQYLSPGSSWDSKRIVLVELQHHIENHWWHHLEGRKLLLFTWFHRPESVLTSFTVLCKVFLMGLLGASVYTPLLCAKT